MVNILLCINIIILLICICIYLIALKSKKAPRLFALYLGAFILFIESHIILAITTSFNFGTSEWFFNGEFDYNTKTEVITSINLFIIGMILGSVFIASTITYKSSSYDVTFENKSIARFSWLLLVSILPFVVVYLIKLIAFISSNGFYSLYINGNKISGGYILDLFFLTLYSLLISLKNKKKILFIILCVACVYLFIGTRLEFMFKVFPVLIYYILISKNIHKYFRLKNILAISILFWGLIFSMQYSVSARDNIEMGSNIITTFLKQQGVSVNVIGIAIKDKNNSLLSESVILSPLYDSAISLANSLVGVQSNGNSVEFAENSFSLSHKLSYLEDPSAYLAGYGVGGAAIAELYIVGGYLACLIGGMLTYIFISILEKIAKKSFFNFIFVMLITGKILYSPRG
ncbi:O107/O117 family O-antigen polymerase, partial [Escherichia coli]|nr:O107/O117 family O-antigen polymerase wzy_O107/O117 [Escherichia coli]EJZ0269289.1 O107/O117 family O-antigen polymerase [Escherichia coli]